MSMSYEPSHRKPPRQERWPQATPAEGWPSYRDQGRGHAAGQGAYQAADSYRGQDGYQQAPGGSGYRPAAAMAPFPQAGNDYGSAGAQDGYDWTADGYGHTSRDYGGEAGYRYGSPGGHGARTADGYAAGDGYGAGNGGSYHTGGYPSGGYAGDINGYVSAPDGFDGALDGYRPGDGGYGTATREYPGDGGYGTATREYPGDANGYDRTGDGYDRNEDGYGAWDGYAGSSDHVAGASGHPDVTGYTEAGMTDPAIAAPDAHVHPDNWQADQEQRREAGRRGLAVGTVTGLLAVAVGIGVSTLAAAFVGPQASPAAAMGGVFVDRTPAVLRTFAAAHFGVNGHAVLLLAVYAGIAVLAVGVGLLTRRAAALGVAGVAAISMFGAFVTITRPDSRVSDIAPSVAGGVAAAAALLWLVRASAPVAPPRPGRGGAGRRAR